MSSFRVGCYVTHKKLAELGSGEVVMVDKGAIRIRFASGERNFLEAYVDPHLEITAEAPVAAPRTQARKSVRKPAAGKQKLKAVRAPEPAPPAEPIEE